MGGSSHGHFNNWAPSQSDHLLIQSFLWILSSVLFAVHIMAKSVILNSGLGIPGQANINMNLRGLRFNVIGRVINEKLLSSHYLCWGKLYFRNSHLSGMIEEIWELAREALSGGNENKNRILFVKQTRPPPSSQHHPGYISALSSLTPQRCNLHRKTDGYLD